MPLVLVLCLLAVGVPTSRLHAQRATPRTLPAPVVPTEAMAGNESGAGADTWMTRGARALTSIDTTDTRASTAGLIATGLLAAGASAAGDAVLGYNLERSQPSPRSGDDPGLTGLIVGWLVGPALVTPAAVHLVNGGNGSVGASYGAAAAIVGVGVIALRSRASGLAVTLAVGGPLLQAISAVAIERATERRRDRTRCAWADVAQSRAETIYESATVPRTRSSR
jgi:hypothetical protein